MQQQTPLVDGHNDLHIHYHACREGCPRGYDDYDISKSVSGHTDLPRWKQGGVGAQLLNSGWLDTEPGLEGTLKGFAFTREMATRYPDRVAIARTSDEIRSIHRLGRLAVLIALEDPDRISVDEATIKRLAAEGLRSDILAYDEPTALADGHAGAAKFGGLSPQGEQTVRWMQQNGILVDLSHASADTARDVLDQSIAPVIFSHSSAAALCDVSRNVPDDVLRRLTANGGIVMVSFVPEFTRKEFSNWYDAGGVFATAVLEKNGGDREKAREAMDGWEKANPQPVVTVADVANHIEHVRDVAGIDHVGFGSDFDGIDFTVTGLEDVSKFPNLLKELARRGWSDADMRKVSGENFLRVLDVADAVANSTVSATDTSSD
ncbi:MAG: dipeptidase [Dokdonella sp.]